MACAHVEKCGPTDRASFGYLHCRVLIICVESFTSLQNYRQIITPANILWTFFMRIGLNPQKQVPFFSKERKAYLLFSKKQKKAPSCNYLRNYFIEIYAQMKKSC